MYFEIESGRLWATAMLFIALCLAPTLASAQANHADEMEFGPIVRAYLQYLDTEQNVVDDRVSRREVSASYYRRNSNRIHALRIMAIDIARATNNDYLPELEAETQDELKTIFEKPPNTSSFRVGEVLNNTFRFLGIVRAGEVFYVFARLDPYEQADLMKKQEAKSTTSDSAAIPDTGIENKPSPGQRPRRTKEP
jgi:hypothetical protein